MAIAAMKQWRDSQFVSTGYTETDHRWPGSLAYPHDREIQRPLPKTCSGSLHNGLILQHRRCAFGAFQNDLVLEKTV